MQYVNDDMDELFRRAAERYPLDTSSSDWNKVAAALQDNDNNKKPGNNNGRFLWLLLLLPFGFLCNRYLQSGYGLADRQKASQQVAGRERQTPFSDQDNQLASPDQQISGRAVHKSSDNPFKQPATTAISDITGHTGLTKKDIQTPGTRLGQGMVLPDATDPENSFDGKPGLLRVRPLFRIVPAPRTGFLLNTAYSEHKNIVKEESAKKSARRQNQKNFYLGIMGSLDATTVKFQKIADLGSDYGGIIGYQLNKRWSLEAGLFIDKKNYYSEGQYFNTSELYMPPNSKVTDVTGECKMFEIPVSLRYNFSLAPRSSWFGTLGTTSYIMKSEDYTYVYYYGSTGTSASHYKTYDHSSKNLFSAINLSAGYAHAIGRNMAMRIEPYLKIPLSGMGIGKLPLMSTGVHLGFTGKLF